MTPNPNPSPELLPCPFGCPKLPHEWTSWGVQKVTCYGTGGEAHAPFTMDRKGWNTRALTPPVSHEQDVSLKVALPAPGEVERLREALTKVKQAARYVAVGDGYYDPYANHGEAVDAAVDAVTALLHSTLADGKGEAGCPCDPDDPNDPQQHDISCARCLPTLATVAAANDEGVESIRRAIWGYVNAQPEDAAVLPVVQFLANRDVFLAEAIALTASRSQHEGASS